MHNRKWICLYLRICCLSVRARVSTYMWFGALAKTSGRCFDQKFNGITKAVAPNPKTHTSLLLNPKAFPCFCATGERARTHCEPFVMSGALEIGKFYGGGGCRGRWVLRRKSDDASLCVYVCKGFSFYLNRNRFRLILANCVKERFRFAPTNGVHVKQNKKKHFQRWPRFMINCQRPRACYQTNWTNSFS